MHYTLPRDIFAMLEEALGSKERAEKLASAIEETLEYVKERSQSQIVEQKELSKNEIKHELKNELITRELFEERMKGLDERFNVINERFKRLEFKLNILIALMPIVITFANPSFIELIKHLFK